MQPICDSSNRSYKNFGGNYLIFCVSLYFENERIIVEDLQNHV